MTTLGFHWSLAWHSPYTEPPDGAPRVLAEMFMPARPGEGARCPSELEALHIPGAGYSLCCRAVTPPPRKLSPETLASVRRQRLQRRMQAKAPLLADDLIAEELAARPDYYAGITDAAIEARRDAAVAEATEHDERLIGQPHALLVYADHPATAGEPEP